MAAYTVSAGDTIRPYETRRCRIQWFPEDASQTFQIGDVLIQGGAGLENKVKISADNPTAAIVGIAAGAASGTTGNMVPVWCADPHCLFIGRVVTADGLDYTDLGNARAIQKHGTYTNVWVVDTTDAGNDSVIPRSYRSPSGAALAEGDTEMEVIFDFKPAATVWGAEV